MPDIGSIGRLNRTLERVSDDEAVSQQPLAEESLKNGRQWIYRHTWTDDDELDTGDNLEVLVRMPDGAEDVLRVVARTIDADEAMSGTIYRNAEVNDAGDAFSVFNARIVSGDAEDATGDVYADGNYDVSNVAEDDQLPIRISSAGTQPGASGTPGARSPSVSTFRVTPGANLVYDLESQEDNNGVLAEFVVSERPKIDPDNATE